MQLKRSCGLLLPVTALPSPGCCGDLGPAARRWLEFCRAAGCSWWQILPFGPTGYGNSPYQCYSAFAGNPLWISPEDLATDGLIDPPDACEAAPERVDYQRAWQANRLQLTAAWDNFRKREFPELRRDFEQFQAEEREWLEDYALFMVIREHHDRQPWRKWPLPLRRRDSDALAAWADDHTEELQRVNFEQWLFHRQWRRLREAAGEAGVGIIGDIPIFVALDSADVWAQPGLFKLDAKLQPRVAAGVPPDYFTPDGQLWGNPIYDWEELARQNYAWWVRRVRHTLHLVDQVRLDHFRGFDACWEVPLPARNARRGEWVPAPGRELLTRLRTELGELPFIAEDLGLITPAVHRLRDDFGLPGMTILQFAFNSDHTNSFLPHNFRPYSVAYSGTHDNDTTRGWWEESSRPQERKQALAYLRSTPEHIVADMVRTLIASTARLTVIPLQDLLEQDGSARINLPGTSTGNWEYRCRARDLAPELAAAFRDLNQLYGRVPDSPEAAG